LFGTLGVLTPSRSAQKGLTDGADRPTNRRKAAPGAERPAGSLEVGKRPEGAGCGGNGWRQRRGPEGPGHGPAARGRRRLL